jgi:release factor glutamine methyltransferase
MAYLIGQREFRGHVLRVSPDVLIPRPDTELLVELGLAAVDASQATSFLDLGTGSGAIAISVALARPNLQVTATDFSSSALAIAQTNAKNLDARIQWWQGNWYEALPPEGRFDVIVSNPPYIAGNDRHLLQGDLRFEPRQALTDEEDGLSDIKTIIDGAALHLNAGGQLWLEHGYDQGRAVQDLLGLAGFSSVKTHHDLAGQPRVTGGSL